MIGVAIAFAAITSLAVPVAFASDAMPVAQQNALVQKYCAVCHTDAARNGGLSLQHFDAAQAPPSLAAMMVSKLSSGVLLETVRAAAFDPSAAALVAKKMKTGAMGAAGIPIPDKATIDALIYALALEAKGANEWHLNRAVDPETKASMLTASILRELPSAKTTAEAAMFRLVLVCNTETHAGEMQLAWAPAPRMGPLSASVDRETPLIYKVESTGAITAGAAVSLNNSMMLLPTQALGVKDLYSNESVEFPFNDLTLAARQSLAACFKR